MAQNKTIEVKGTKPMKRTIRGFLDGARRYICHEGGARSGKTFGILIALIWFAETNAGTKISVVSHSLPHLKRGAFRDFMHIMTEWGWYDESMHNKTDGIYHFANRSYIEFFGLEDPGKARGPARDVLFVNEANLISKALFDQLDMRTTKYVVTDLNPSDFDIWCYHLSDSDKAIKVHSTYLDNPFLTDMQRSVIEGFKDADPMMWKVFGMGERGASQEQIYTHYKLTADIPPGEVFYGLDFGFRVPTALVRVTLAENQLYVHEMLYEPSMTTTDLIERLPSLGIMQYDEIFCDAAEPKTIEELYRHGWNVKGADKDVYAGIMKVKSLPMFITASSTNLHDELRKYKWKTDRDGKVIDKEPVKLDDHLVDAMRYAVYTKMKQPRLTWAVM